MMAIKKYKPVTPSLRGMTGYTFEEITKTKPERSLIISKKNHAGRNVYGRIAIKAAGTRRISASSISNATNMGLLPV
jgi:large subunit ribosomal protein L2